MKKQFTLTALMIISLIALNVAAVAQVRVTGHVFAEVVEAAGATAQTSNTLEIQQQAATSNFQIGQVTLNSGAMRNCEVMITTTQLSGISGTQVDFETLADFTTTADERGNQVINLNGKIGEEVMINQDKVYSGQYNVVFAYN